MPAISRRGLELRRSVCKRLHTMQGLSNTLHMYVDVARRAEVGTEWYRDCEKPESEQVYPEPAVHPTRNKLVKWKAAIAAKGLMGLFIQTLLRSGAQVDGKFRLATERGADRLIASAVPAP